jgi:hypothetical protein
MGSIDLPTDDLYRLAGIDRELDVLSFLEGRYLPPKAYEHQMRGKVRCPRGSILDYVNAYAFKHRGTTMDKCGCRAKSWVEKRLGSSMGKYIKSNSEENKDNRMYIDALKERVSENKHLILKIKDGSMRKTYESMLAKPLDEATDRLHMIVLTYAMYEMGVIRPWELISYVVADVSLKTVIPVYLNYLASSEDACASNICVIL